MSHQYLAIDLGAESGRVSLGLFDGEQVSIDVVHRFPNKPNGEAGLLRIGDINFVSVNGEVYSQIAMKLKDQAPANKTIVVTLANGAANSGYIYSDDAYSHLTFQVIGSRLKPGCAEGKIIDTALGLMRKSGE